MTETQIQKKIKDKLTAAGWQVVRLRDVSPPGYPDLLAYRGRRVAWIEVKTPSGRLSELQKYRQKQLGMNMQETYVIDRVDDVNLQLMTE